MFRGFTHKGWVSLLSVTVAAGVLFGVAAGHAAGATEGTEGGGGLYAGAGSISSSLANAPAVAQPSAKDTASWPIANGSVDGTTYSFHYPSSWTPSLIYCAPGAGNNTEGGHLPKGCASTDILVGQKAIDVGLLSGSALRIDGKNALKAIDRHSGNVLVSQVYTTMVYSDSVTPLFGFTTQIGPGTDQATLDAITATLDAMASTIKVEARR